MSDLNLALIIEAIDKATAHPREGREHVCRSARVSQLIFKVTPVITTPPSPAWMRAVERRREQRPRGNDSFYLTICECVPCFAVRWFRAVCMLYRGRESSPMQRATDLNTGKPASRILPAQAV